MKLSDVMSAMGLAGYAEIALLVFFAIFLGVVVHVYRREGRLQYERARFMPLEDEVPLDPRDELGSAKEDG
jgi:cbb3-type cytochrome oxidase subunit 3